MSTMPPTAEFVIETNSVQQQGWEQYGQGPTISVNGSTFASLGQPNFSSGYQLVVINAAGDLTNPSNIWFNAYIELQNDAGTWSSTYTYMYDQIIGACLTSGNIEQQLILLASFGLDVGVPPDNDCLQFLLQRGAGPQLQGWDLTPDVGSQGNGWVAQPVSYIFVGGSGYGYADGWETFVDNGSSPAAASLTVTLTNNVPPTPLARHATAVGD